MEKGKIKTVTEKESLAQRIKQDLSFFKNIRQLCFGAILAAMSLLLGKFLQIPNPFQDFIRISFENAPVILAGITMGPLAGAFVGIVADLLGCLLSPYGYTINPMVTLGAAAIGFLAGLSARYFVRRPLAAQVVLAVILSHTVGSVFLKSMGLAAWYAANYDMGFWAFVGWRAITYLFIAIAECVLLILLLRNRGVTMQLERLCKRK